MASSPMAAWRMEPDLENRDPNNVNDHLKVAWEDLIGEPDHTHSLDCCWKCSFKCFNLWKSLCYCLASSFCSCCIMMGWGCYFAIVAFCHIWLCVPSIRAYEIDLGLTRKMLRVILAAICDPIIECIGKCFSAARR